MDGSTTLYLIEHGMVVGDGGGDEVINGWSDRSLSDAGRERMTQTARMLEGLGVGETYSSDLPRAVESAEVIRRQLAIAHPNTERRGLRPMDAGLLAGLTKDEGQAALDDALARPWAKAVPGGSQPYAKFLGLWTQELARTIHEALEEDHACAYVTHSHNLGALAHLLSNGEVPPVLESPVSPGGIIALRVRNGGADVTHEIIYNPGD